MADDCRPSGLHESLLTRKQTLKLVKSTTIHESDLRHGLPEDRLKRDDTRILWLNVRKRFSVYQINIK